MTQSTLYMQHCARMAAVSVKPLTYPQFIWTVDNATTKTYVKRVKKISAARPNGIYRKTFLPEWLLLDQISNQLEMMK